MKIHHLNCATLCPWCARLINGRGGWLRAGRLVCHCLLIETPDQLVLVDTGLGTQDLARPERLGGVFNSLVRPRLDASETALAQVLALGFRADDVRHIVLTHLDLDHAGGLADFPRAQVHVHDPEYEAAMHPGWRERLRYLPAQWAHGPAWVRHRPDGEDWFGFQRVRAVPEVGEDILLIPLAGHTRGHCGVAIRHEGRWLMHCGDAYFSRHEVSSEGRCPPGLRLFQSLVEIDRPRRLSNRQRLRELALKPQAGVDLICAHDPVDFERFNRSLPYPGSDQD